MQNEEIHPPIEPSPTGLPIFDYAPPWLKPKMSFEKRVGIAVLAIGLVLYTVACIPAFDQRSWPPGDHLWEGTPWLWVFPIPMFALIMPACRFSRNILLVYALLTSGVHALTYPFANMNPHEYFEPGLWFGNLVLDIPVHLVLTVLITLLSRLAFHVLGVSPPLETTPQSRWHRRARIVLLVGIPALAVISPLGYRAWMSARDAALGAAMADTDWANQSATFISNAEPSYRKVVDFTFTTFFDANSGLALRESWMGRWEPGYNAEISNLMKTHGNPPWSPKSSSVSDADMLAMLTVADMKEITSYPYVLSPNVVLLRGGGTTPWGDSIYSNTNYLDIESRIQNAGGIGLLGDQKDSAFVGQLPKYPGVYFIRCGNSVTACTASGWVLQTVTVDK